MKVIDAFHHESAVQTTKHFLLANYQEISQWRQLMNILYASSKNRVKSFFKGQGTNYIQTDLDWNKLICYKTKSEKYISLEKNKIISEERDFFKVCLYIVNWANSINLLNKYLKFEWKAYFLGYNNIHWTISFCWQTTKKFFSDVRWWIFYLFVPKTLLKIFKMGKKPVIFTEI